MIAAMARIVALAQASSAFRASKVLRPLVVSGCALALILARDALPL